MQCPRFASALPYGPCRLISGTSVDFPSPLTPVANGLGAVGGGESHDYDFYLASEKCTEIIDGVILAFHPAFSCLSSPTVQPMVPMKTTLLRSSVLASRGFPLFAVLRSV
jgi:hypothetical protein